MNGEADLALLVEARNAAVVRAVRDTEAANEGVSSVVTALITVQRFARQIRDGEHGPPGP